MSNNIYAVVEFVEEKSVEIVASTWIESSDGDLFSYWPQFNAHSKVKSLAIPDKTKWQSYNIRVFSYRASWKRAEKLIKKALATSNIDSSGMSSDETEESSAPPAKRARIKASLAEFPDISETEADNEDEFTPPEETPVLAPLLPVAPTFETQMISAVNKLVSLNPQRSMFQNQGLPSGASSSKTGSAQSKPTSNDTLEITKVTNVAATPPSRSYQPNASNAFQRSVLTKLDTLIEKYDETLSILRVLFSSTRGASENELLDDIFPSPLDTINEMEELCSRLDDEFRKKMLHFLVALCGYSCANSVRRVMAKLRTNNLWCRYSLKGRKAKLAFKELALCKIIVKACLRTHKVSELNVEEHIREYLKYAPSKPGAPDLRIA